MLITTVKRLLILTVALFLVLLITTNVARADLKATNNAYAWESSTNQFLNSNVRITWNGSWEPFVHELNFDNDLYTGVCSPRGTRWAGTMEFGLYHEDNAPALAQGFQQTRNWSVVYCDRDGDGDFDNTDRRATPPTGYTLYQTLDPGLLQDVETPCSTGNCALEIITTLEINLDQNCDGVRDVPVTTPMCFYAEALVPVAGPPYWSGPLQARITSGGGDKTVNFDPRHPTAITLLGLNAASGAGGWPPLALAALVVIGLFAPVYIYLKRLHRV